MLYVMHNKENSSGKMASRACFFAVTRATISPLNLVFSLDRLTINTILGCCCISTYERLSKYLELTFFLCSQERSKSVNLLRYSNTVKQSGGNISTLSQM